MKNLLLTVLAFGLLSSSSAFAQEEGLQKSSTPVSLLLKQISGSAFSPVSTLIARPAAMLISVSPNNRNTAAPRLRLQPVSPATQKKTFASSAMSTRLREFKSIIPKLADPDSSCVNSSGTSIAKKYSGPMRYGHSAQAPTLAKMSQALRSLVLRTGQTWRIWRDELLASTRPPFPTGSDACFIAYYASAELGTFCALNWSKPHNIIDLFAE